MKDELVSFKVAKLAKEKGAYPEFKGSEWETGAYFTRRGYTSDRWIKLAADV